MNASELISKSEDGRDASYVRVSEQSNLLTTAALNQIQVDMYVDIHARKRNVEPEFKIKRFYGQLQRLLAVPIRSSTSLILDDDDPPVLVLAVIRSYDTDQTSTVGMEAYPISAKGRMTVVDVSTIQCLIGRVRDVDVKRWAIIDRAELSTQ